MPKQDTFRFRKLDSIGSPDAQQDTEFLGNCFVDTGLLKVLRDCSDSRRVIVGRTGSGKTALIQRLLDTTQNVIVLPPEQLAIGYIANSNILQFVGSLGVKLDLFFRLLWRHALVVEIVRKHSALDSEVSTKNLIQRLRERFDSKRQTSLRRVLDYMETYTGKFWEDTERRIKEVTCKVERDIKASISTGTTLPASFGIDGAKHLSTEQREEVVQRAQSVVNQIQIRELSEMIRLLDEILDDPQQQFYVVIDRLDEDWVEDKLRYGLIRALLETVREFHQVRNAKIVVALRLDLVDRVFSYTRDSGFQQEKYEGELLRLEWKKEDLLEVLDRRVAFLVKRSYTSEDVSHRDVMPRKIGGQATSDFIIDRTLMRPRDAIQFFNACIQHSDGKPQLSERAVLEAEGEYSRSRLQALADEWYSDYPNLLRCCIPLLQKRPVLFTLDTVTRQDIEEFCLRAAASGHFLQQVDVISESTLAVAEGKMDAVTYWYNAVEMFYRVGLVGVKTDADKPLVWSISGRRSISTAELHGGSRISVHKCFRRVLGITDRNVDRSDPDTISSSVS
jgi:hypothetical protein